MHEISPKVFIETSYSGVTLGAIDWTHGLILVDAPFRSEDVRSWRSNVMNMGGGVDRLLINLDAQVDRNLGVRSMDCTVIGHEKLTQIFRTRPITFKPVGSETGADWEQYDNFGSIRWASPDITFSHQLQISWEDSVILLESHPGPSPAAIWIILPKQSVIFIGDTAVADQPPFLASADIAVWIEDLHQLLTAPYRNFLFVSGRSGLITHDQIKDQIKFLERVQKQLDNLSARKGTPEDTSNFVSGLLKNIKYPPDKELLYQKRLQYGLNHLFRRHFSGEIVV
jgi:glyoxylase-like metal-dependent hydrolase (beta-lactamase superfamily II)